MSLSVSVSLCACLRACVLQVKKLEEKLESAMRVQQELIDENVKAQEMYESLHDQIENNKKAKNQAADPRVAPLQAEVEKFKDEVGASDSGIHFISESGAFAGQAQGWGLWIARVDSSIRFHVSPGRGQRGWGAEFDSSGAKHSPFW